MEGRQREAVIISPRTCGSPPPGGRAHGYKGIGGSPRQCARNLKRGLPTMPLYGWGRGGIRKQATRPRAVWRQPRGSGVAATDTLIKAEGRRAEGGGRSPHRTKTPGSA